MPWLMRDIACGKGRMMGDNAKQRQLRVEPPFLSALVADCPALRNRGPRR